MATTKISWQEFGMFKARLPDPYEFRGFYDKLESVS